MEKKIKKIIPYGVNLSIMTGLGNALIRLAEELRQCYDERWGYAMARHILSRVNADATALDLPEITIDFDFLDKIKEEKQ
jgi:hypothetical protein